MELFPSYGGAPFRKHSKKVIRLILKGCTNRPFFHISVQEHVKEPQEPVIEQIGNYDPLPNQYNEKLVSINFQRLEYWLRKGAVPTVSVLKLLARPNQLLGVIGRKRLVEKNLFRADTFSANLLYRPCLKTVTSTFFTESRLSGYFPVHPDSFRDAFLRRKRIKVELENLRSIAAKFSSVGNEKSPESAKSTSESELSENGNSSSENTSSDPETKA